MRRGERGDYEVYKCVRWISFSFLFSTSLRRLCAEVPEQWSEESSPEAILMDLVRKLSVFCLEHSAESEACDMLMEIEKIDLLLELVAEDVHERVCLYLIRLVM